jgi:hypothetical protein
MLCLSDRSDFKAGRNYYAALVSSTLAQNPSEEATISITSEDAMRTAPGAHLFSTFAHGAHGAGLLFMRLVAGIALVAREVTALAGASDRTNHSARARDRCGTATVRRFMDAHRGNSSGGH